MASPSGCIFRGDDGYTLRFERHLPHSVKQVWSALTEPEYLAKWIADATVELRPGGDFILDYAHSPKVMEGKITRLREYALLEYTWSGDVGPQSLVTWELLPQGPEACLLVLTHSKLAEDVQGFGAGWHTHIDLMAEVLDGTRKEFEWDEQWWKSKLPDYGTGS